MALGLIFLGLLTLLTGAAGGVALFRPAVFIDSEGETLFHAIGAALRSLPEILRYHVARVIGLCLLGATVFLGMIVWAAIGELGHSVGSSSISAPTRQYALRNGVTRDTRDEVRELYREETLSQLEDWNPPFDVSRTLTSSIKFKHPKDDNLNLDVADYGKNPVEVTAALMWRDAAKHFGIKDPLPDEVAALIPGGIEPPPDRVAEADALRDRATALWAAGDRAQSIEAADDALTIYQQTLGAAAAQTLQMKEMVDQARAKMSADATDGVPVTVATQEVIAMPALDPGKQARIEEAQKLKAQAAEEWGANNRQSSLDKATRAHATFAEILGPDHAQTREMRTMLDAAASQLRPESAE